MKTTNLIPLIGNTYPLRLEIRKLGGKWDANLKCWLVPSDKHAELTEKVLANTPANPYENSTYVPLKGNTYPISTSIRNMGGKWNKEEKVWMVPQENYEKLLASIPPLPKERKNATTRTCYECGGKSTYVQCVRNGGTWSEFIGTDGQYLCHCGC